jgi:hypothetical protein
MAAFACEAPMKQGGPSANAQAERSPRHASYLLKERDFNRTVSGIGYPKRLIQARREDCRRL